jgi:hypothetical protein
MLCLTVSCSCVFGSELDNKVEKAVTNNTIDWADQLKNGVKLVIYYYKVELLTNKPVLLKDIKEDHDYRIIVTTNQLKRHLNELEKLNNINPQRLNKGVIVDVRVHGEFVRNGVLIYSFSFGTFPDRMLINGDPYKIDHFFCDFAYNFMPFFEKGKYKEFFEIK